MKGAAELVAEWSALLEKSDMRKSNNPAIAGWWDCDSLDKLSDWEDENRDDILAHLKRLAEQEQRRAARKELCKDFDDTRPEEPYR